MIKILFASRLVHEKWVDILIDCIEFFIHDTRLKGQIEWHICSDGEYQDTIRSLTKKYENVYYYGKISKEKLNELYKKSDILLMPSRFLEMFGLTALEALEQWTPVIWPRKWWLRDMIPEALELDEKNPIHSIQLILEKFMIWEKMALPDIDNFSKISWDNRLAILTQWQDRICIVHDYQEKIGGAEYYIDFVIKNLKSQGKHVTLHTYTGTTSIWKRRLMFIFSLAAFWRGINLWRTLMRDKPTLIWLNSILRYMWPWGMLAVRLYRQRTWARVIIAYHDLWLLTAFPQDITDISMIPESSKLKNFIPKNASMLKKIISIGKWCYVRVVMAILGDEIEHVVFSSFLIPYIQKQTKKEDVILFPHCSL